MNKKKISLAFKNNSMVAVAGDEFGRQIFEEQVKSQLTSEDYEKGFEIIFPDQIEIIGSSFIQGFSNHIIGTIGYDGIRDKVIFKTSSSDLTEEIYDDLF